MTIYFIVLSLISILGILIFLKGESKKKRILFLTLSAIIMFCVMGFRNISVGTDTQLYCTIFENVINSGSDFLNVSSASPLYAAYNKVVSIILGTTNQAVILANSLVIISLIHIFIYKKSKNVVMSVLYYMLFYFYLQGFNIARQFIAVALVGNSFKYILDKKILKFILFAGMATLIHNTAIIFLIIGIIYIYIKPNLKNTTILISGISILSLFFDNIINIFLKIFPRYTMYFTTFDIFYEVGKGRKIIMTMLYAGIVIIGILLLKKKEKYFKNEKEYREMVLLTNFISIAVIIGIISLKSILISRIEIYFSIFIIIYLPLIVEKFRTSKYFIYFLSIMILFIPFYILLSGNNSGVVPYEIGNWKLF